MQELYKLFFEKKHNFENTTQILGAAFVYFTFIEKICCKMYEIML